MDPKKSRMILTMKFGYSNRVATAMSLQRVARKDCDELYVAALFGEWDEEGELESSNPEVFQDVNDSYADVFPVCLPKELPP